MRGGASPRRLWGALAALVCLLVATPAARAELRAGAAVADITPPVGTPMFAYTARSALANPPLLLQILADPDENLYAKTFAPSEGIHTRVRAAAIVIQSRGERFALVQADLGGLPYALVREVLERTESLGIDGEHLLLAATHTHSSTGPIWPADSVGYQLLGGDLYDPRVFALTAEGIVEAIAAAASRLRPARVGVAATAVRDASSNRSFESFRRNPDVPADPERAREVSVDRRVTVLRVDTASGRPLALWSSFAVHPTSFGADNLLISGDNVASAQQLVERAVARIAARPGGPRRLGRRFVSAWTNAAEGDVSPEADPGGGEAEPLLYVPTPAAAANLTGVRVGRGIVRAWRRAGPRLRGRAEIAARRTFVAFDGARADGEPVGPIPVLGLGGIFGPDGTCAPVEHLAGAGQGMKFPGIAGRGLVPDVASVSLWRLGRLGIAAFPFEITTQMGRRITAALADAAGGALRRAIVAGLANGYISYVATPEEYDACNYEGSFTLFGRRQGARVRDAALSLVDPLLGDGPVPESAPEPPPSSLVVGPAPAPAATPAAGEPVSQPASATRRYGRARFEWRGGDPAVDPERGRSFVRLERRLRGRWRSVGTEEGPADTTVWDDGAETWTETWQFGRCDALGTYRFRVRGRAIRARSGPAEPYALRSEPFRLKRSEPIELIDARIRGRRLRVRARYPDPGEAPLALPRRVGDGVALATVRTVSGEVRRLRAMPGRGRRAFRARAPRGARLIAVRVRDACGNTSRRVAIDR